MTWFLIPHPSYVHVFRNHISQSYKTNTKVNATIMVTGIKSTHFQECRWKDTRGKVVSCPRHESIQGAAEVQLHSPLTSARRRGWVRSPSAQDRTPVLRTGGLVGTATGMAVRAEGKISCKPYRNVITYLGTSVVAWRCRQLIPTHQNTRCEIL